MNNAAETPTSSRDLPRILPPGRLTLVGAFRPPERRCLMEDHQQLRQWAVVSQPPPAPPPGPDRDPFRDSAITSGVVGFAPVRGGVRTVVWDRLWSFPGPAAPDVEASWWAAKARNIGAFGAWPASGGYAFFEPDGSLGADLVLRSPSTGGHLLKVEVGLYSATPFRLSATLRRGLGGPDRVERIVATPAGGSGEYQVLQAWVLRANALQFSLRWDQTPASSAGVGLYHLRLSRGLGIGVLNP